MKRKLEPSEESDQPAITRARFLALVEANAPHDKESAEGRFYVFCTYDERDEAKAKGARWDPKRSLWYVPSEGNIEDFSAWLAPTERYLESSKWRSLVPTAKRHKAADTPTSSPQKSYGSPIKTERGMYEGDTESSSPTSPTSSPMKQQPPPRMSYVRSLRDLPSNTKVIKSLNLNNVRESDLSPGIIYFNPPFPDNDVVKGLGALFDVDKLFGKKQWCIPPGTPVFPFLPWLKAHSDIHSTRTYLYVPFSKKNFAKAWGAQWDPDQKLWYVSGDVPQPLVTFLTNLEDNSDL
jgi:hypothetical protein